MSKASVAGVASPQSEPQQANDDGWIVLTVPRGNERELCSHGEQGFLPFRMRDSSGKLWWLVRVPRHTATYFCRAGFWPAADELQNAQPPQGPVRSFYELQS